MFERRRARVPVADGQQRACPQYSEGKCRVDGNLWQELVGDALGRAPQETDQRDSADPRRQRTQEALHWTKPCNRYEGQGDAGRRKRERAAQGDAAAIAVERVCVAAEQ